jgi:hypothetical protein
VVLMHYPRSCVSFGGTRPVRGASSRARCSRARRSRSSARSRRAMPPLPLPLPLPPPLPPPLAPAVHRMRFMRRLWRLTYELGSISVLSCKFNLRIVVPSGEYKLYFGVLIPRGKFDRRELQRNKNTCMRRKIPQENLEGKKKSLKKRESEKTSNRPGHNRRASRAALARRLDIAELGHVNDESMNFRGGHLLGGHLVLLGARRLGLVLRLAEQLLQ